MKSLEIDNWWLTSNKLQVKILNCPTQNNQDSRKNHQIFQVKLMSKMITLMTLKNIKILEILNAKIIIKANHYHSFSNTSTRKFQNKKNKKSQGKLKLEVRIKFSLLLRVIWKIINKEQIVRLFDTGNAHYAPMLIAPIVSVQVKLMVLNGAISI